MSDADMSGFWKTMTADVVLGVPDNVNMADAISATNEFIENCGLKGSAHPSKVELGKLFCVLRPVPNDGTAHSNTQTIKQMSAFFAGIFSIYNALPVKPNPAPPV